MTHDKLPRQDDGKLAAYAWPGGYPLYYLDSENSTLCPSCANKSDSDDEVPQFKPIACGVHYEGAPIVCDQCGAEIESAYGDPEVDGN